MLGQSPTCVAESGLQDALQAVHTRHQCLMVSSSSGHTIPKNLARMQDQGLKTVWQPSSGLCEEEACVLTLSLPSLSMFQTDSVSMLMVRCVALASTHCSISA